jgi:hypothetical protein
MSSFIAYSLKSNFIEFRKFYAEKIDLDEKNSIIIQLGFCI